MNSGLRREAMSRYTPPCGCPASRFHLGVDGACHFVTWQQFGGSSSRRVVVVPFVGLFFGFGRFGAEHVGHVIEHEPLTVRIAQDPTVATNAFGDEQAAHTERPDHARRVELDALHVDQLGARPQRHGVTVPGTLPRVGREFPRLTGPARGEDDGLGVERDELPGRAPVRHASRDAPVGVVHQFQDLAFHKHVGAHRDNLLLQRSNQFETRAVSDVRESCVAVPAEVALEDLAVLRAVKEGSPLFEFPDTIGGFFRVQLGHAVVVEVLAPTHGVAKMDHPVVLGIDVSHGGRHASFGHDGVGLSEQRLGDDANFQATLFGFNRGAQSRATRPDDQDVVFVVFVGGHKESLI